MNLGPSECRLLLRHGLRRSFSDSLFRHGDGLRGRGLLLGLRR
jgi:hypothetical protein